MSTLRKDSAAGTIEAAALPAAALSSLEATIYHQVEDKELKVLMREKALAVVAAAVFFGIFFGTVLPAGKAVFDALSNPGQADPAGLLYLALSSLSLGIGISSVVVVLHRRSQTLYALEAIRKRSAESLLPGKRQARRGRR